MADDKTISARTLMRGRTLGEARTSLVIYFDDKTDVVPLEEGTSVVLGRSEPADVVVPEPNLSRRHARFTALEDGVRVEDLGSTNGTHFKGERISELVLGAGESVTLGRVTVSVNRAEGRADLLGDFVSYFDFVKRLRDEVVRARTFRRGVAVFFVRAVEGDTHVAGWAPGVRALLRPVDRMALYGASSAFVLAPETEEDRARVIADKIADSDPRLVVGVSIHHATAEELIDQARRLGRAASASARVIVGGHDALVGASAPLFASAKMIELEELIERVSRARIPVLITGETGSGKEIVAQAIHQRGPRAQGPMLAVSCAALPASLAEDVLFGHQAGAFEGASSDHAGLFEQAEGGTLFLDEVGELPDGAQGALLRVLETKKVRRLGADEEIGVDVRVVAATNRDLHAMVEQGRFRSDLLYRLAPITVRVPPLRERDGDVDPFVDRFLSEASVGAGARVLGIEDEARAALHAYPWPGNVRELKNAIEEAVVACTAEKLRIMDLPRAIGGTAEEAPTDAPALDLKARVRAYERGLIAEALERAGGDAAAAAKLLGMPLRTLEKKMKSQSGPGASQA